MARLVTKAQIQCANCAKLLTVEVYSAGMSDVMPFTCSLDSTVLTISTYDKGLNSIQGGYPRWPWSEDQWNKFIQGVEERLISCPCGGKFKHNAMPKCPNCGTVLNPKLGSSEFVVVSKMTSGDEERAWQ